MKKAVFIMSIAILMFSLCGCRRLIGWFILEEYGKVTYDLQIDRFQTRLLIDLEGFSGDDVNQHWYELDDEREQCVEYIDFEGKSDEIESQISDSEYWQPLPLNDSLIEYLETTDIGICLRYNEIENGSYIVSCTQNGSEYTITQENIDSCENVVVGIWDADDEMLYYIEIFEISE